jgi:phytoene desaturase
MLPGQYKEIFTYANKKYEDYINFIKIDPLYRVFCHDKSSFDIYNEMDKLMGSLESISHEDAAGYLKFTADTYEKYLIADKHFLQKSYRRAGDFFNFSSLLSGMKINPLSTAYNYISKYISDERLREYLSFQGLLVGISPYNGPNIYTILPSAIQSYGLWYLKGGMYSFIWALERLVNELRGTIETNSPVDEIMFSGIRAVGVKALSKEEKAGIVICSADYPYAMDELIKCDKAKGKYTHKKLSRMQYSCSTFIMYLGLKKKYDKLAVHNLYLGNNFRENIEMAFTGELPISPTLYIYCPSRIDKSTAPEGMETVNITVRVPNLQFTKFEWDDDTINTLKSRIYDGIHCITGLEDIEENVVYENYLTPRDMLYRFNAYKGAAFGLSPNLMQSNYFRPHIKSTEVESLYFVGNSVHPGTGISNVLISSKLAVDEILKDG